MCNLKFTIKMNDNDFEPCISNLYAIIDILHIMKQFAQHHIFILHDFFLFQYM